MPSQIPTQQSRYSPAETTAMEAELNNINATLTEKEKYQEELEKWMGSALRTGLVDHMSGQRMIADELSKLFKVQHECQELFERKILLEAKLQAAR